jgi:hypothetical protein
VALLVLVAAALAAPQAAMAWKPFTHNYIGDQVWAEASTGFVTLSGINYSLPPGLGAVLKANRASYNAGVVGPDGFPDLAYGQSVIHPDHTGKWLAYVLQKARDAQTAVDAEKKPIYTAKQKAKILAFSYGYLTHAAGDLWGHTLINDFADGLFPSLADFADRSKVLIGMRHVVAEAYVGSATPGWDRAADPGNRRQICTRYGTKVTGACDWSDDTTHGIRFDVPRQFIYETFVNPANPLPVGICGDGKDDDGDRVADDGCPGGPFTVEGKGPRDRGPEPQRGPLVDYFLDYQAELELEFAERDYYVRNHECNSYLANCSDVSRQITVHTVRGDKKVSVTRTKCTGSLCASDLSIRFASLLGPRADLKEWISDIKTGLQQWGSFSLAVTKALFDPQTRRDVQNSKCGYLGDESKVVRGKPTNITRANCESGVSALSTVNDQTTSFVNHYLFEMLGLPNAVGDIRESLSSFSRWIDERLGEAFNPVRQIRDAIEERIATFVKDKIREATGFDYDEVRRFVSKPARWMCGASTPSITLPKVGDVDLGTFSPSSLFRADQHARLDTIMGLPAGHHQPALAGATVPTDCRSLKPDVAFDPEKFAPMKDSIVQAKLLLLDGTQLNLALGDAATQAGVIGSRTFVHTYPADGNVMYTPLAPATQPWLGLIDGDHAWRENGLPTFCERLFTCDPFYNELLTYPRKTTTQTAKAVSRGGLGTYPVWESCVLRPAFRALFSDWENNANAQPNFPDLGDAASPDPASDPNPPTITLTPRGVTTTLNGRRTVLPGGTFQPIGHDDVFNESVIEVSYRVYAAGTSPGTFQSVGNRGTIPLPSNALAGNWVVEVRAQDPCGSSSLAETFTVV